MTIRMFILAAAAALLVGCTDVLTSATKPESPAEETGTPDNIHCRNVARGRADDALTNGYGLQIEERVFQEAYQDCMAWRSPKPD